MKRKFFGINLKVVLMALTLCGVLSSCYEKEEIHSPSLDEPVHHNGGSGN